MFCYGHSFQRIQYSKSDSDMIAKMKGTFSERPKKPKRVMPAQIAQEDAAEAKKMKRKAAKEQARVYQQQIAPAPVAPVPQPVPMQMG